MEKNIRCLAGNSNVYCKLSGLVTEADLEHWKKETLLPFVKHVVNVFGCERVLFGGDWPVCLLAAGGYKRWFTTALEMLTQDIGCSEKELVLIFNENAKKVYKIN